MRTLLLSVAAVVHVASPCSSSALREAELLPANDEVHTFLEMLSNLGRLRN